jgi:hypothetical protein
MSGGAQSVSNYDVNFQEFLLDGNVSNDDYVDEVYVL